MTELVKALERSKENVVEESLGRGDFGRVAFGNGGQGGLGEG